MHEVRTLVNDGSQKTRVPKQNTRSWQLIDGF